MDHLTINCTVLYSLLRFLQMRVLDNVVSGRQRYEPMISLW
jgi:hypothetical protein